MTFELSKVDLGYGKSSCVLEPADPLKQFVSLKDDPKIKKMLAILVLNSHRRQTRRCNVPYPMIQL